jgi:hypothetical protein
MNRPPTDQLLEFLAPYDVKVGEIALALREIVLKEVPEARETLFRGYAVSLTYSLTDRWTQGFTTVSIGTTSTLGFLKGAVLPDPKGLLGSGR